MNKIQKRCHPAARSLLKTLILGKEYLHQIRQDNTCSSYARHVIFLGYTSCPGVVIVRGDDGCDWRVSRSELVEANTNDGIHELGC